MSGKVKASLDSNKRIKKLNRSRIIKKMMLIFLSLFTLIIIGAITILRVSENTEMAEYRREEWRVVDTQLEHINDDVQHISSDLALLAHRKEMANLWDDNGLPIPELLSDLSAEYLIVLVYRQVYDQIRLIDENGLEIVRVNFNNGAPDTVAQDELQNKSARYYFDDAFRLNRDEVFVSPLDLNIENGEIEQPLKPMIRFATPVFDQNGIKRGIVLLNYLGSDLIERFSSVITSLNGIQSILLNADGYWLVGPNSEDEWGFMYDERKDRTFQNFYPEAWEVINSDECGQIETSQGLFTFRTAFPLLAGQRSSTGSGSAFSPSTAQLEGKEYHWKIVSFIPADILYSSRDNRRLKAILIVVFVAVVILFGIWRVVQEGAKRTLATEALLESETLLRQIIDLVPHFVFVKDETGKFELVNEATAKVFGTTVEDLTGRRDSEFVATEEEMEHFRADDLEVINSGKIKVILKEPITDSENNIRYLQTTKVPFRSSKSGNRALMGVSVDITERVKAEEALAEKSIYLDNILRSATEYAIATTNLDLRITYFNPLAEQFFGYKSEEVIGKTVQELHTREKEAPERFEMAVKAIRLHGEYRYQLVQELDYGKRYLDSRVSGIYDLAGELVGFALFSIDVTERKRMEEEQLKIKKLESLGILAGGIAHDFNNLLTALLGNMELAKMYLISNPDQSRGFLEEAGRSMETAVNLTRQLLTFAKGGDPIREIFHIADIIVDTAQFLLRGSNVKLKTNIDSELYEVEADKGQLNQVITNLVLNAKQAMPEGGVVTITAENIDFSGNNYIQIRIQDTGTGIALKHLEKIFDPYFTTKQTGSGLGLASCHSIISKHNGNITVASELNVGTTFTILLPAVNAVIEADTVGRATPVSEPSFPCKGSILVLDDEEEVRGVLGAMLKRMGCVVAFATEGQDAIEKYKATQFDLVITDLTLPGDIGGDGVAKEILVLNPDAKIIVSSGYANSSIMANYKEYGFQGRIAKPYNFAALQKLVERILKG